MVLYKTAVCVEYPAAMILGCDSTGFGYGGMDKAILVGGWSELWFELMDCRWT